MARAAGSSLSPGTLLVVLLVTRPALATDRYVRADARGANNGSDWTNAYTDLNACIGAMVRSSQDTCYVAGGTYTTAAFDKAASGTDVLSIKKATASDHGTDDGWSDAYGTAPATWTAWAIESSYWNISGVTGGAKSGFGFRIHDGSPGSVTILRIDSVNDIWIDHIDASAAVFDCDTETNLNVVVYAVSGGSNLTIQQSFLHDHNSWGMVGLNGWDNVLLAGNYFMNACRKELVSARFDSNFVFKNNVVENAAGTGILVFEDPMGVEIYNNTFFTTDPATYSTTDCLFCNWYNSGMTASDVGIYGNTFVNLEPQTTIGFDGASNVVVQNNLFYGPNGIGFVGTLTHDYNWCYPAGDGCSAVVAEPHGQVGASDPFSNVAENDFRLSGATTAGLALPAPYDVDSQGYPRGTDGTWDRGAFEFNVGSDAPPSAPTGLRVR